MARTMRQDPAILCDAHTYGKETTFANPIDTEPTYAAASVRVASGRPCVRGGLYRVDRNVTCREHLALLVDESVGDWDGSMVAVTVLTAAVPAR